MGPAGAQGKNVSGSQATATTSGICCQSLLLRTLKHWAARHRRRCAAYNPVSGPVLLTSAGVAPPGVSPAGPPACPARPAPAAAAAPAGSPAPCSCTRERGHVLAAVGLLGGRGAEAANAAEPGQLHAAACTTSPQPATKAGTGGRRPTTTRHTTNQPKPASQPFRKHAASSSRTVGPST